MSSIMVNLSLCKHMHDVTVTSHDLDFVIFLDRIAVFSRERKTCEFMEISSLLSVVHMRIMNINQEKKFYCLSYLNVSTKYLYDVLKS